MNTVTFKLKTIAATLILSGSVVYTNSALAELTNFAAGDVIKASEMNANFQYLQDLIQNSSASNGAIERAINCSADAQALVKYFNAPDSDARWVTLNLTGNCAADSNGEISVSRDRLMLSGGEVAGTFKTDGKQNIVVKGVNLTGSSDTNRVAYIDAGSAVYFEGNSYPANAELLSTSTSALAFNDSVDGLNFHANLSSRLYFYSPSGTANRISLDTSSSMEYGNLSTTELLVTNAASFRQLGEGTLTVNSLGMASNAAGQVFNLNVSQDVDLFASASLAVENQLTSPEIYVGAGATLDGHSVSSANISIETGSSLDIEQLGSVTDPIGELWVRGKSAAWAQSGFVTRLGSMDSSIDIASLFIEEHVFLRKSTLLSENSLTLQGTNDFGSFSYLEVAYPIDSMCSQFNRVNVEAWSFTNEQSFPYSCP